MTKNSVFLRQVNNGYTNFLNAEKETVKIASTGVFLCQKGEVHCTLDGKDYVMGPQSMMTYFAFSELKINYRSSDLQGIMIAGDLEAIQPLLYKTSDFNSLFLIRSNPMVSLSERQVNIIIMYARLIEDLLAKINDPVNPDYQDNTQIKEMRLMQLEMLGNSLMLNIVLCYSCSNLENKRASRKEDVLMKFVSSLYKNYREEHEVSYYADQQFLTSRYFSAIIKEKSGKTPSQWIATALLVEAKQKLLQSTLSVKEISEFLNFPNQSYFGKWFKNLTGISPLEFKSGKSEIINQEDEFAEMVRRGASFVSQNRN